MTGFGTMSATDLKKTISTLSTLDKALMREWKVEAKKVIAEPLATDLSRQAPGGRKGAAAGRSIKVGSGALPVIYAGKGTWEGWQPFFALEYGMNHNKVHTYLRRSRNGGRHVVRRRTGTWAPVHLNKGGYWFWPYFESHLPEQRTKAARLAEEFIRRELA